MQEKNVSKTKSFTITFVSIILVFCIIAVLAVYTVSSQNHVESYARYAIRQNAEEISKEVDAYISNAISSIQLTARTFSQSMTSDVVDNAPDILTPLVVRTPFNFIEYIDKNGINRTEMGEQFDASDRVYYKDGIIGNTNIWLNFHPKYSEEYLLNFYTPLYYGGDIVGVLTGTLGARTDVLPLLETNFFGEPMIGILCDGNGQVIASNCEYGDLTYLSGLLGGLGVSENGKQAFYNHINAHDASIFEFREAHGRGFACVNVNEQTDWSIIQIVPAQAVRSLSESTSGTGYIAIAVICAFLILFLFFIVIHERKMHATALAENEQRIAEQIAISITDELTGLANRRAYEDDIKSYRSELPNENCVFVSADVNGLKNVNDSLGHAAGDALLFGAAQCLKQCLAPYGKVYRVGGDEFTAIIFADAARLDFIITDLNETAAAWKHETISELSISYGFASRRDFPEMSVDELVKHADNRMYEAKAEHYRTRGLSKRGQHSAYATISATYLKILKINITKDRYQIIHMDLNEINGRNEFTESISQWLHDYGVSGRVHKDDLSHYLEKTDVKYLSEYFRNGADRLCIFYRRMIDDKYAQSMMEIMPSEDYTDDNQCFYLFVKGIYTD